MDMDRDTESAGSIAISVIEAILFAPMLLGIVITRKQYFRANSLAFEKRITGALFQGVAISVVGINMFGWITESNKSLWDYFVSNSLVLLACYIVVSAILFLWFNNRRIERLIQAGREDQFLTTISAAIGLAIYFPLMFGIPEFGA